LAAPVRAWHLLAAKQLWDDFGRIITTESGYTLTVIETEYEACVYADKGQ
jgi:hypothetical protein